MEESASLPPTPSEPEPGDPAWEHGIPYTKLNSRVRAVWTLSNLGTAIVLGVLAAAAEGFALADAEKWPFPYGTLIAAVVFLFFPWLMIYPHLQYRAWRYVLREHDVILCQGVFWQTKRSVPRQRIQHVDIRSGPLERAFGLVNLTLFTAGTGEADAKIPGMTLADAETLRETLLHHHD